MKDHVEIGHMTKYDALRVNRDQVMKLKNKVSIFNKNQNLQSQLHAIFFLFLHRWNTVLPRSSGDLTSALFALVSCKIK